MLSYQHAYHAGNFADVIKHLALTRLLHYLMNKEKAFFYFESHAGQGTYDLKDKRSEKTGEYKQGIRQIWPHKNTLDPVFEDYLQAIYQLNESKEVLRFYPGSPWLAMKALRKQDRAYLCELHPREYDLLDKLPHFNKKIHISNTDGIACLSALLPPPEKRGLIFIDPSFEIKEEYKEIPRAIKQAVSRFSTGVYCLWYPMVYRQYTEQLLRGLKAIPAKQALQIEFSLTPKPGIGMSSCGLWIINPPFTFAAEMQSILNVLKKHFNPGFSSYTIEKHSSD